MKFSIFNFMSGILYSGLALAGFMPIHLAFFMAFVCLLNPFLAYLLSEAQWLENHQARRLLQVLSVVIMSGNSFNYYPLILFGLLGFLSIGFWRIPLYLVSVGVWIEVVMQSGTLVKEDDLHLMISSAIGLLGSGLAVLKFLFSAGTKRVSILHHRYFSQQGWVSFFVSTADSIPEYQQLNDLSKKRIISLARCKRAAGAIRLVSVDGRDCFVTYEVVKGFYHRDIYLCERSPLHSRLSGKRNIYSDFQRAHWSSLISVSFKPVYEKASGFCVGFFSELSVLEHSVFKFESYAEYMAAILSQVDSLASSVVAHGHRLEKALVILKFEGDLAELKLELSHLLIGEGFEVIDLLHDTETTGGAAARFSERAIDILECDHVAAEVVDSTYSLIYLNSCFLDSLDKAFTVMICQLTSMLKAERGVRVIAQGGLGSLHEGELYDCADFFIIDDESWSLEDVISQPRSLVRFNFAIARATHVGWEREVDLIKLASNGLTNKEIASILNISQRTVAYRLKDIYNRVDAKGRSDAIVKLKVLGVI